MGTLHCALENGAYLYVNERQKIRHYCTRSTEERRKKNSKSRFFYFARCVRKLELYSDLIHSFNWKSVVEHDGGVKCLIVYLARDIPAFVMYCVYGESRSSLLIESLPTL